MVLAIPTWTLAVSPAFANSRSATVRVSCTILPILELSSVAPQNSLTMTSQAEQIRVNTNLKNLYRVNEKTLKKSGNNVTLYSVTAL